MGSIRKPRCGSCRAARALGRSRPVSIRTTFLGAHALPPEADGDKDRYIDLVCREMLPAVAQAGLADAVDAFMEGIAFSGEQTARVFRAAKALGLPVKLHADQLSNLGGAALASEFSALSADHLEHTDEAGVAAMARAGTVAVLLPGAFYFIRETTKPPVELFRAHGVNMALATDCNPGSSPLTSLLLAMNMGATLFRMTVAECLAGVTREGARALGVLGETGTLEAGKWCDLAIWDIERPAELDLPDGLQSAAPPGVEGTMSDRNASIVVSPGTVSLDDLAQVLAGAAVVLDPVVLAARRGRIGHCCAGRGCASAGLRHQYRVRKTGVETHSAGSDDAAAAQPHCVALLRGRAAHARTDRASDDGAEDRLVGARRFGRSPRNHRATPGHAGARHLSAGAAAGIGGRVRRSGAAGAYDGRHDRRGAGACRRQGCAGP